MNEQNRTNFTFHEIVAGDVVNLNRFANMFIAYMQEIYGVDNVPIDSWDRVHRILTDVSEQRYRMWVAYDDKDQYCGFAGLSDRGELSPAWVAPTHRKMGLHGQLIDLRVMQGGWFTSIKKGNVFSEKAMLSRGFVMASRGEKSNRYALIEVIGDPEKLEGTPDPGEPNIIIETAELTD